MKQRKQRRFSRKCNNRIRP